MRAGKYHPDAPPAGLYAATHAGVAVSYTCATCRLDGYGETGKGRGLKSHGTGQLHSDLCLPPPCRRQLRRELQALHYSLALTSMGQANARALLRALARQQQEAEPPPKRRVHFAVGCTAVVTLLTRLALPAWISA